MREYVCSEMSVTSVIGVIGTKVLTGLSTFTTCGM